MANKKILKGKLGVSLVITELIKNGIDAIPTPDFWIFDVITFTGLKLEVKFANASISRGGSGYEFERFTFAISPLELKITDFIILVLNTQKGALFYVIPPKAITSTTIAFNPFSQQKSKYEKYQSRWDLIKIYTEKLLEDSKIQDYFNRVNTFNYRLKKTKEKKQISLES